MLFHTLSHSQQLPFLFFCHSSVGYSRSEEDTPANPQGLWNAKAFPCRVHHLFPPHPHHFLSQAPFCGTNTAQGNQAAQRNWSDRRFSGRAIVSPVSFTPPRLHAPDYKYKAMPSSVNAKPKPHTSFSPESSPGLWPRLNLPSTPPIPWGPAQSLQRTAEPGTGEMQPQAHSSAQGCLPVSPFTSQNLISHAHFCWSPILGAADTGGNP